MALEPVYAPAFIPPKLAAAMFTALRNETDWLRRDDTPRFEYWDTLKSEPYTYGRGRGERTYQPQPHLHLVHTIRLALRIKVRKLDPAGGGAFFEGCFLNRYVGGRDQLGWHADDDLGIDHTKPIAIVTLGQGREINWKLQGSKGEDAINRQFLEPGSLLLMPPGMQQTHFHRIPKAVDLPEDHERISLTYKCLL
jgi:alkylated DNA repair dioxygenase AlkB